MFLRGLIIVRIVLGKSFLLEGGGGFLRVVIIGTTGTVRCYAPWSRAAGVAYTLTPKPYTLRLKPRPATLGTNP